MNNLIYIIVAVIAFIFGGTVIGLKDKHAMRKFEDEAKKQAGIAVDAMNDAENATKEREASRAASKASSSISNTLVRKAKKIAVADSIKSDDSRKLTDKEKEDVKKIMLDND